MMPTKIIETDPKNPTHCSLLETALNLAVKRISEKDAAMIYFALLEEAEKSEHCAACGAYGAEDTCESCGKIICHRCADYATYEDVTICSDLVKCEESQIRALAAEEKKS